MFSIQNYSVSVGDISVVKNCNLQINAGSVHALMGPNGSGKSSLVASLMGHPAYTVHGNVTFQNQDFMLLAAHQKALQGLFLAMQHPIEIEGLQVLHFLQELARLHKKLPLSSQDFLAKLKTIFFIVFNFYAFFFIK